MVCLPLTKFTLCIVINYEIKPISSVEQTYHVFQITLLVSPKKQSTNEIKFHKNLLARLASSDRSPFSRLIWA
jgi:hypothetical protein